MNFRRVLLAACLAVVTACSSHVDEYRTASGSLAVSADGKELYAVDSDNDLVAVLDASTLKTIAEVKVGRRPQRVAVAKDGSIFVTNFGDRSVSVIRRGAWEEASRVEVGIEPKGIDVTGDGEHVLVASATSLTDATVGTLTSVDAHTLNVEWSVDVGPEAYAVKAMPGGKAYVSLFKTGQVAVVDLETHRKTGVINLGGSAQNANLFGAGAVPAPSTQQTVAGTPNLVSDIAVSPDGDRAFVPHVRARDGVIVKTTEGGGGYGGGASRSISCGRGAIAAAAVGTIETSDDATLLDDFTNCRNGDNADFDGRDYPPNIIDPNPTGSDPVQNPEVALVDPNGEFLYVANLSTNNVVVLSTHSRKGSGLINDTGVTQVVRTGTAPTGLAVAPDGKTLFVHHQFDHSVGVYRADESGRIAEVPALRNRYAQDVLPKELVEGRKLFFSADNPIMTNVAAPIACASCHPNGREDGRVWAFPDGPRQTPSLAGRLIAQTAPYHWSGEFDTINQFFDETVKNRMGGKGFADAKDPGAKNLMKFLESIETPDNPRHGVTLTAREQHGKAVFEKAGCVRCHTGDAFTDNLNHSVGTFVVGTTEKPGDKVKELNTPSLLGIARTWPYLHDGSALTLKARLTTNKQGDLHGLTGSLEDTEIDELVDYLKTL